MKNTNEINELRAKDAVSDLGKHWDLVDKDKSADDFGGNHTVYELLIAKDIYAGETGRTLKERFDSGHGYDNQPLVKSAIEKVGWENVVKHTIIEGLKDRKTAENYEKQVIKIRKANLCNNEGGRGNVKGAQYNTGHYIEAIKNGIKSEYRTLQDAANATGNNPAQICKAIKSGRKIKGYTYRYIDKI